jgi:hypothetical protein
MLVLVATRGAGGITLGVLLGACVLTRHVGICLVAAVVIDRLMSKRWRDSATIGITAVVVVIPWIGWLATVKRSSQAELLQRDGLASLIGNQSLFYARRLPDVLTGPFVEVATVFGRSRVVAGVATVGAIAFSLVVLLGLIQAVRNPRKRLAGLVPLTTFPLLLIWPFTEAGRFLIPLVPCLLVGLVEGFAWIARRLASHSDGRVGGRRRLVATLILVMTLPYPIYSQITNRAKSQRLTHVDFDAACGWIANRATQPGPVMTRHPGEVFWQTGRKAVQPSSEHIDSLLEQIDENHVAYLLVDPERYANAPPTPLARLARSRPDRVRLVRGGAVEVYEVQPR